MKLLEPIPEFKCIACLIPLILLLACNTPKTQEYILLDKDSVNMIEKNYYENGILQSEVPLHNKQINGIAKQYYKSGKLNLEVGYNNGVKQGEGKWYFENGVAFYVVNYKDGKIEGIARRYDSNGKLIAEIPYKDDIVQEGLKEYDAKGALITDYPEIKFALDKKSGGKVMLKLSLTSGSKNVSFYQIRINHLNEPFKKYIPTKDGIGQLDITPGNNSSIANDVQVYAEYLTPRQNMKIIIGLYRR